jgi:hypothetical protein
MTELSVLSALHCSTRDVSRFNQFSLPEQSHLAVARGLPIRNCQGLQDVGRNLEFYLSESRLINGLWTNGVTQGACKPKRTETEWDEARIRLPRNTKEARSDIRECIHYIGRRCVGYLGISFIQNAGGR